MPDAVARAPSFERLRATVARAARAPHYRRVFGKLGFDPKGFTELGQLRDLPFTVKDDLRSDENFPYGFLTVRRDRLVRLHSSSGTTGSASTWSASSSGSRGTSTSTSARP